MKIPDGKGYFYGDGEYNNKFFLNEIVKNGYIPIIKKTGEGCKGFGAFIRGKHYDEIKYKKRSICEGLFGAITTKYGDRLKTRNLTTTTVRLAIRILVYAIKILHRYNLGDSLCY